MGWFGGTTTHYFRKHPISTIEPKKPNKSTILLHPLKKLRWNFDGFFGVPRVFLPRQVWVEPHLRCCVAPASRRRIEPLKLWYTALETCTYLSGVEVVKYANICICICIYIYIILKILLLCYAQYICSQNLIISTIDISSVSFDISTNTRNSPLVFSMKKACHFTWQSTIYTLPLGEMYGGSAIGQF